MVFFASGVRLAAFPWVHIHNRKIFRKIDVLSFGFPLLGLSLMGQLISGLAEIFNGFDFIPHFLIIEILLHGQLRGLGPPCLGRDRLAGRFQIFQKMLCGFKVVIASDKMKKNAEEKM